MRLIAAVLFLCVLFSCARRQEAKAAGSPEAAPADLLSALERPDGFVVDRGMGAIPENVRAAFAKAAGDKSFAMAEPGGAWRATDVVLDRHLPHRRFIAVAKSAEFYLVFYERGGIARSDNVAAFRMVNGAAEPVWHAFVPPGVADPAGLREALGRKAAVVGGGYF